ncbi:unnamed protein product [Urochloa decumbens]|uniref:Uncharacterized protein n=1 Tax=Urochloa decumbens TaxID=240449 RepID=A0ABC9B5S3_9POAL
MAKLTINYVKTLTQIVDQLGLEKPKITSEKSKSGTFHATIEVDLVNWVSMGYRGPREFTASSPVGARKAIWKAARKAINILEKCGLVRINDFSGKELKLWKKRVMDITKVCKEIVEERDFLEDNCTHLGKKHVKLLAENARLEAEILRLEERISGCIEGEKEGKEPIINIKDSYLDGANTSMKFMEA